jgi:hypothetical protein
LRKLATIVRDFLEIRLLRQRFHPARHDNCFRPVFFLLVDRQQEALRCVLERRAILFGE